MVSANVFSRIDRNVARALLFHCSHDCFAMWVVQLQACKKPYFGSALVPLMLFCAVISVLVLSSCFEFKLLTVAMAFFLAFWNRFCSSLSRQA